jgi:hypothetical protein
MAVAYQQVLVKDSTFTLLLQPEHRRDGATVAPNPFTNETQVTVECLVSATVRLVDVSGREVQRADVQAGRNTLNLGAALAPGMYWLHVEKDGVAEPPVSIIKQ